MSNLQACIAPSRGEKTEYPTPSEVSSYLGDTASPSRSTHVSSTSPLCRSTRQNLHSTTPSTTALTRPPNPPSAVTVATPRLVAPSRVKGTLRTSWPSSVRKCSCLDVATTMPSSSTNVEPMPSPSAYSGRLVSNTTVGGTVVAGGRSGRWGSQLHRTASGTTVASRGGTTGASGAASPPHAASRVSTARCGARAHPVGAGVRRSSLVTAPGCEPRCDGVRPRRRCPRRRTRSRRGRGWRSRRDSAARSRSAGRTAAGASR